MRKAAAFWERCRLERAQPGHCSRCGRENDAGGADGKRGICGRCREYSRAYKARKLAERLESHTATPQVAGLLRRIHVLELRWQRFARILRAQYKAGYATGLQAERQRWSNMPRGWDSWSKPLDVTDVKQHFHRAQEG